MAVEYFILAGPQAAGKSTLAKRLCGQDSGMISLEESRQIIVHKYQRKGAIFMTNLDEIEVVHHDMTRMFTILGQDQNDHLYLDETNVFTLGHARAHGIDLLEGYFKQYCDLLARLQTGIVFVDVPPDISWERRRHRYTQRLWDLNDEEKQDIMARYEAYLERLYPELLAIFNRLDFPKVKIDGMSHPEQTFREASQALRHLRGQI
jgi:adenylate kinase family enzyme